MESMKSVITCDMEGRITSFNKGAESIFGYGADEVIDRKRVSLFSPGETVLEHVPAWLKKADEEGEYVGKTVFVRKDNTRFAAKIKITPTFKDKKTGERLGYCGVSEVIDEPLEKVRPSISKGTHILKWLIAMRAPFTGASILACILAGFSSKLWLTAPFVAFGALLSVVGLHLYANVVNDIHDVERGVDDANNGYFLALSGGSRVVELGLFTQDEMRALARRILVVTAVVGSLTLLAGNRYALGVGLLGLVLGAGYTAPPLYLIARKGLGELTIALTFGPLIFFGYDTLAAESWFAMSSNSWILGTMVGLWTAGILWANQIPDAASDRRTGKTNLLVTMGESSSWLFYALLMCAPGAIALLYPPSFLSGVSQVLVAALILVAGSALTLRYRATWDSRDFVVVNKGTIAIQHLGTIALIVLAAFS